jgi:hypothetical protein
MHLLRLGDDAKRRNKQNTGQGKQHTAKSEHGATPRPQRECNDALFR